MILQADSILRRGNDPSLVQVYRQEESLAVRMMYKFSTLLEHFTLFRTSATHGNRLPDDLLLSPLRELSTRKQCKPEASNAEQSEEVCYQGWRFTLHIQGWTQLSKGNVTESSFRPWYILLEQHDYSH